MQEMITVTARNDGRIKGKMGEVLFEAVVYREGSDCGIRNGRVSQLLVKRRDQLVAAYNKRWEKPADKKDRATVERIVNSLEALPT